MIAHVAEVSTFENRPGGSSPYPAGYRVSIVAATAVAAAVN